MSDNPKFLEIARCLDCGHKPHSLSAEQVNRAVCPKCKGKLMIFG